MSRVVKTRDTSRLILADDKDAVLLFLTYGADHSVSPRWITPGGGVDPGEDFRAAAIRELFEETGLVVDEVGEPFATVESAVDQRWHRYDRGTWAWFALRTPRFTPSDAGWMPDEVEDILEHRWWTADDLESSSELYEPPDLPALIRQGITTL